MTDRAGQGSVADARLLRRVRWRLLAWSGGSTLVVLFVLGAALYTAVARSLEAAGTDQLRQRAEDLVPLVEGPLAVPPPVAPGQVILRADTPAPGVVFL